MPGGLLTTSRPPADVGLGFSHFIHFVRKALLLNPQSVQDQLPSALTDLALAVRLALAMRATESAPRVISAVI